MQYAPNIDMVVSLNVEDQVRIFLQRPETQSRKVQSMGEAILTRDVNEDPARGSIKQSAAIIIARHGKAKLRTRVERRPAQERIATAAVRRSVAGYSFDRGWGNVGATP